MAKFTRHFHIINLVLAVSVHWPPLALCQDRHALELTQDWTLRNLTRIRVANRRGKIEVHGWSQDKIRVISRRIVPTQAVMTADLEKWIQSATARFRSMADVVEVTADFGSGLDLGEKLRERRLSPVRMDLIVYAPARSGLEVWGLDYDVSIRNWKSSLQVRTQTGAIGLSLTQGKDVSVGCVSCEVAFKQIRATKIQLVGQKGKFQIEDARADHVFVENTSGVILSERVLGHQTYVTQTGAIQLIRPRGWIEFQTDSGDMDLSKGSGFVSGRSKTGKISIDMAEFVFRDRALIESESGDVTVILPRAFSGEVELEGGISHGPPEIGFTLLPIKKTSEIPQRRIGLVGKGGEVIKIRSSQGKVRVLQGGGLAPSTEGVARPG